MVLITEETVTETGTSSPTCCPLTSTRLFGTYAPAPTHTCKEKKMNANLIARISVF